MSALLKKSPPPSVADVLRRLGGISPNRIGLPVGTATEQDLLRHLDAADKRLYELVDGILVEKDMGMREALVGKKAARCLDDFVEARSLGVVFPADGPIRLRVGHIRIPDVGFVSWERIPGERMLDEPILDAVPNLAVEVVSKGNTKEEMAQKLKDYFKAGVELVWYIYPRKACAEVYTSPTAKSLVSKEGFFDGGIVLPGLRLPLKEILALPRRPRKSRNGRTGR
jgi:Uma2 family endonuclease